MKTNILAIIIGSVSLLASAQSIEENLICFTSGHRATIILPITPDAGKGKYYRLDRCEVGKIVFEEEHLPKARVPYIIVPNEDFKIDISTLDCEGLYCDSTNIVGVSFIGTYNKKVFGYKDSFYYHILDSTPDCRDEVDEYLYVGPLRAFLEIDWRKNNHQNLEEMEVVLHEQPSLILEPSTSLLEAHSFIYDLQGRRLSGKPAKGLYIQNGKKVAVK